MLRGCEKDSNANGCHVVVEVAEGVFEDIKSTWYLIIGFCVLAMVVSLLWIFLLRYISKVLIWFSMFAFLGICGFGELTRCCLVS